MAIDYSKWDNIELSDDSDIEVHPNVDKKSFIRWKQQDIHQKREERNQQIKTLETQKAMYLELNRRVDQLLSEVDVSKLADFEFVKTYLAEHFDPNSKPEIMDENGQVQEHIENESPAHNEMIEDLFIQLKSDVEKAGKDPKDGSNIKELILAHRQKIDDVLKQAIDKLDGLYKDRSMHISSDDIHTGWDRSFLNKGEAAKKEDIKPTPAETSTPINTSSYSLAAEPKQSLSSSEVTENSPPIQSSSKESESGETDLVKTSNNISSEEENEETLDDLHPDTITYSKISTENIDQIKKFLKSHTHIIKSEQKDSLLMKAFDAQFAGDDAKTFQVIFLSTLLQYILDIVQFKHTSDPRDIGIIVEQLLSKMFVNRTNPAYEAFKNEIGNTFNHIKERCRILSSENAQDEENQEIQIKSLDEDTKLVVNLPDSKSENPEEIQRYESFQKLPKEMQDALKTESLDEVNKVFHGMPIAEAEAILEIFEECGVIGVQALIENEEEWKEIKNEYNKQFEDQSGETETPELQEPQISNIENLDIKDDGKGYEDTADIVD